MSVSLEIDKRPEIGDGRIIITTDSVIDESPFYMNNHRKRRTITFYVDKASMPELESQLKARYSNNVYKSYERFRKEEYRNKTNIESGKHFDEPKEPGLYLTQSGNVLFNDCSPEINWMVIVEDREKWKNWIDVLDYFDDSEFPLIKLTNDLVKKAVQQ